MEPQARRWLKGVGDPDHEWTEDRYPFFHLRRRLTPDEAEPIGEVVDVRGTWEATKRLNRVAKWLPPNWTE